MNLTILGSSQCTRRLVKKKNEMAREKALKRGNWFEGGGDKEEWKKLTKTTDRRMNKKKVQKAESKNGEAATLLFFYVPRGAYW